MCEDEDVKFVDNSTSFYLKDGSINDAYYLEDGVHLTYKATNKLAQKPGTKSESRNEKCICHASTEEIKEICPISFCLNPS